MSLSQIVRSSVLINTSCVDIKHQLGQKGIGVTQDPFGKGAYYLQSISITLRMCVRACVCVCVSPTKSMNN